MQIVLALLLLALFHDFPTYFSKFVLALWLRNVCYYKREKEKYVRPSFQVISVFQIHFMVWIFPLCCFAEEFKEKKLLISFMMKNMQNYFSQSAKSLM